MDGVLLAGDVGATKTRLALYRLKNRKLEESVSERYESNSAQGLGELVHRFLAAHPSKIDAACFGLPGPVRHGTAKLTNISWTLAESELARQLGVAHVRLLNDLAVIASALPHLTESDLVTLHRGKEPAGEFEDTVFTVVAPGTGLGEGFAVRSAGIFTPFPSQGGHAEFAPTDELQTKLYNYLKAHYGRVSLERVLSGPGLFNIYQFLRDERILPEPAELRDEISAAPDPVRIISDCGLADRHEICAKSLDIFCSVLGTEAGDVMLRYLSYGGVFLGGGIPPRILPKLHRGPLLSSYFNKGRMTELVKDCSLHVIRDDRVALLGAAAAAASQLQSAA